VKANREFELLVSRGGSEPAFLADPRRRDRLEVVSVQTGEVVLFWELPARAAAKLKRQLQTDLNALDAAVFLETWSDADATAQGEEEQRSDADAAGETSARDVR
jgi:hypothetical protein